jgi:hypothetical protein
MALASVPSKSASCVRSRLSIRQMPRQRYLERAEKRFSLDGVVTEPTDPSNCLNLGGNPFLSNDNLALGPLKIGK